MKLNSDNNSKEQISILYTNHRNKTSIRRIIPERIWFGSTKWHRVEQWILFAFDIDKEAERGFAIKDIKAWFKEDKDVSM